MRCLFTMFAEDVHLLRERIFSNAFDRWLEDPTVFPSEVEDLWTKMDQGGTLWGGGRIWRFNGGLFADPFGLPLDRQQLQTLKRAAESDWADVEPAIFGTLLERALDPQERHRLGAHYTPRAYVERLVRPTIEEPLRNEWETVRATVRVLLASPDADANRKTMAEARAEVSRFLERLTQVRILDPACGTGNFLYVSLDVLKRLENEALEMYDQLGGAKLTHYGRLVSPQQFLGIEIKRWAKEIAELVLWIGYLQWQVRTKGFEHPDEPILRDYHNIECRDALLAYDEKVPLLDDAGQPVTRWDGVTMKRHPVTGEDVPDDRARVRVYRYVNPRRAEWPEAEFIVGNPPFIGNKRMRAALGDGYVETLRDVHPDVPESADYVMYWWHFAAGLVRCGVAIQFGLITTNSITQVFNRRIVGQHLTAEPALSMIFAIADHPWVDIAAGAAVRVSMTVVRRGFFEGQALVVIDEEGGNDDAVVVQFSSRVGRIDETLTVRSSEPRINNLRANDDLSFMGVTLGGQGFVLEDEEARRLSPHGSIRPYVIGRDLTQRRSRRSVIDFTGLTEAEARADAPELLQIIVDRVKPEREQNSRLAYRNKWWLFAEQRVRLRHALASLNRFIVTCRTAKHRTFEFVDSSTVVESTVIAICLDDAFQLGILASRPHLVWALHVGSTLEDRPRYNNSLVFETFPFPATAVLEQDRIRIVSAALESHRKQRQGMYGALTITAMYNVVEKLRSGEPLTDKEKIIHEQGLVSVLKQLHDELDAAVFDAYGWPHDLTDEQILERLVSLNAERAEEERRGIIRWLRPEFQNAAGAGAVQQTVAALETDVPATRQADKQSRPWPKELPAQIAAVREVVTTGAAESWSAERTSRAFKGAKRAQVEAVLESLSALGLLIAFGEGDQREWKTAA
jgi:hypothetical protein